MKTMKSSAKVLLMVAAVAATACTEDYKKQIEKMQGEAMQDSLDYIQHEQALADSLQFVLTQTLEDIRGDLNAVLRDEGVLVEDSDAFSEEPHTTREDIRNRIADLGEVLKHNKYKIDQLAGQLKKSNHKNRELEKTLAETRAQLQEHERTIEELLVNLEDEQLRYVSIDQNLKRIIAQNDSMGQRITSLDEKVHTAYYTVGSYKDLKEKGVLTREGGILSIGAAKVLDDDFSGQTFEKIDIRKQTRIPVHAGKVELVTEHPSASYSFAREGDEVAYLEINDPDEFWKASKYMVLQTR